MSASPVSKSIERLAGNRLAYSAVSLTVLITGVVTVSTPLLLLSGVLAYGQPFLHAYLLNLNESVKEGGKESRKPARLSAVRPSIAGAR